MDEQVSGFFVSFKDAEANGVAFFQKKAIIRLLKEQ